MLNAWSHRQNILDFKWLCIIWTIKIVIFFFLNIRKMLKTLSSRIGSVIFIVTLSAFLILCSCFHIFWNVDAPLFRIAWLVPCWQFLKFILCILTNNCVSFEVSSKALFLQTTFQLSSLISFIIRKTLWCANAILPCEWFYSRRLFLFWFIIESISVAYLNKKIDSNQGR